MLRIKKKRTNNKKKAALLTALIADSSQEVIRTGVNENDLPSQQSQTAARFDAILNG